MPRVYECIARAHSLHAKTARRPAIGNGTNDIPTESNNWYMPIFRVDRGLIVARQLTGMPVGRIGSFLIPRFITWMKTGITTDGPIIRWSALLVGTKKRISACEVIEC